ncbi:hypothetical protein CTAYLR_009199 [Chrysophaeum taylorii]|uniref:Gamma-glutamylcyclotransferase AIG2-like domain-containing protein n=1 Tax=Chrysophaeum taylorii TaxID=2483200 RepID=A0AAD7XTC5_9STRA|nr:hypothetical protein CTAYLR_009199 [Chrysophaeum taylorii]
MNVGGVAGTSAAVGSQRGGNRMRGGGANGATRYLIAKVDEVWEGLGRRANKGGGAEVGAGANAATPTSSRKTEALEDDAGGVKNLTRICAKCCGDEAEDGNVEAAERAQGIGSFDIGISGVAGGADGHTVDYEAVGDNGDTSKSTRAVRRNLDVVVNIGVVEKPHAKCRTERHALVEAELLAASLDVAGVLQEGVDNLTRVLLSVSDCFSRRVKRMNVVTVFNYGSNGVAQLRARVGNPNLVCRAASLPGYARVFCLRAGGWGGGVASICPCDKAITYGSVCSLTAEEKGRLDMYEGGYREVSVEARVGDERVRAIAYVAGRENNRFTPALSAAPSEAYLTAISVHLRENGWESPVEVRSSAAPARVLEVWRHPGVHRLETLAAVAVEVNAITHHWEMPQAAAEFVAELGRKGIATVRELADRALLENGGTTVDDGVAAAALRRLALHRVFVYGTLLRQCRNHHYLGDSLFLGEAMTLEPYVFADFGAFPFAADEGAPPGRPRVPLRGEVYAVSTDCLARSLDPLESHPSFYRRSKVLLSDGDEAWVYFLVDPEALEDIAARPDIPGGDYRAYLL